MNFLGKSISGPFTIPSGIITTHVAAIQHLAREIPSLGVITTKSISLLPRPGNPEPIYVRYAPGCFMNAVGLTNPGAEAFAAQLQSLDLPPDRFLLVSILGQDAAEFVQTAKILAPFCDGLELNLSCPHAKGYGQTIGQDKALVREITAAVKAAVSIPVIPKLSPNVPDIAEIARAAVAGGADALCAINTVGPGYYTIDGQPVLSNQTGGMSGRGILPIGLRCVREIHEAVNVPLIGCGGIAGAGEVRAYQAAGATITGIGSALTGFSTSDLKTYFLVLSRDLDAGTSLSTRLLRNPGMDYRVFTLRENHSLAPDLNLLVFHKDFPVNPGQFIFARLPGVGEKPFSVLDNRPLTLAIRHAGKFSGALAALHPGDKVHVRGPYGQMVFLEKGGRAVLVSGGCGLAALYLLARENPGAVAFIGARDRHHLFYLDQLRAHAEVHIATEDGSAGHEGLVTGLLARTLPSIPQDRPLTFFNCGPEPMIQAVMEIETAYAPRERIYHSIDYLTRCGVGICGSCTAPGGRRLCVDGPFLNQASA